MDGEITATRATLAARMSRERIVRAVQRGDIQGRYDEASGWMVDVSSLNRFLAAKAGDSSDRSAA